MLNVLAAFTIPLNLWNWCLRAHNEEGVPQLPICSPEAAMNKKIALVYLTEDVLRGCVQLSKHNTSEGQIGINK